MEACHAFSFVDILQVSCDILSLLANHIKHVFIEHIALPSPR